MLILNIVYKYIFIILSLLLLKMMYFFSKKSGTFVVLQSSASILTITKLYFRIYYEFYCKVSSDNVLRFSRILQKLY